MLVSLKRTGKERKRVVKDMPRLGRDYLELGFYTEVLSAEKGVRAQSTGSLKTAKKYVCRASVLRRLRP